MEKIIVHCDGGSRGNPGPAAFGVVIETSSGKELYSKGEFIGHATNNQAEYQGILHAAKWLSENQNKCKGDVEFYLDSELAVKQINGIYKIKNQVLAGYILQIKDFLRKIDCEVSFIHVKRHKNKEADLLVNQALDAHT